MEGAKNSDKSNSATRKIQYGNITDFIAELKIVISIGKDCNVFKLK